MKSWPASQWDRFGLQVAASQVERVANQSWLVIWTAVDRPQPGAPGYVTLKGWTSTADLVRHGVPVWTAGVHANVRVPERLVRPMSDLVDLDPMAFQIFVPESREPACGHPTRLGMCWGCATPPKAVPLPDVVEVAEKQFHAVPSAAHNGWRPGEGLQMPLAGAVLERGPCLLCFPLIS